MRFTVRICTIVLLTQNLCVRDGFGQTCSFAYTDGSVFPTEGNEVSLDTIQDTEMPGTVLLTAKTQNVKSIKEVVPATTSKELYIEPTLNEDNNLILTLTDHFVDYEEEEFLGSMSFLVTFECTSGERKLDFLQAIVDTNNHAPEFQKTPYTFKLPMPFPKNVELTNFIPISARDIDVTNKNITFHLDAADLNASGFTVFWKSGERKVHHATLYTNTVINFVEDTTFILYATDSEEVKQTSQTNVTIQVDRENSVARFSRSLYTVNLTNLIPGEANQFDINFTEGEINLPNGASEQVSYSIEDKLTGYSNNFECNVSSDYSKVQIRLKNPPEKFFHEHSVLLTLTAQTASFKESTVLHMLLPGSVIDTNQGTPSPNEATLVESDETGYIVTVVILVILVAALTTGLTIMIVKYRRASSDSRIVGISGINDGRTVVPEMREIQRNDSVSPTGSFRKSVAFNDTIEEINIARL